MKEKIEQHSRNYWNKTWGKFIKFNGIIAPSAKLLQHLVHNLVRGGIVLDIGCGEGRNSLYLSRVGFNVISIDLSIEAVRATKQNFFSEDLRGLSMGGDSRYLPLANESVDGILAHHVFDHMDGESFRLSTNEASRVLKQNGVMLITMDTFATASTDPNTVVKDDGTVVFVSGANKGMLVRPYIESEIQNYVHNGWEILKDELTPKRSKILLLRKVGVV